MFLGSCPSGIRTFTGIILGSVAFRGQCQEEPHGMLQHEELGGEGEAMGQPNCLESGSGQMSVGAEGTDVSGVSGTRA